MKTLILLSLLAVVGACSQSSFDGGPAVGRNPKKASGAEPVNGGSSANSAGEPLAPGEKKSSFSFGPKAAMADFLFVFDNSVSMRNALAQLREGFSSLSSAAWPTDTRIGVMTTLPADPNNLSVVHPDVNPYPNINIDPGFLNLVSEKGRKMFIDAPGTNQAGVAGFSEEMCASEWFKPADKNPAGKSCLSVAIQSPFAAVGVEAGLVALSQIVKKKPQLFRRGTHLNVVFVSDTQDPGANAPRLQALRPTYAQLKPLIEANSTVASIKLHGVTPSETCSTNEGTPSRTDGRGLPYQDAIAASGGVWLDYCDGAGVRSDYKPVAQQIVAGALPEPVFVLPQVASKIVRVLVAGIAYPTEKVTLSADKKSVRIDGLSPTKDVPIEVIYVP